MEKALFEEFPPITDEQWRQQVLQDLKGTAPETLQWDTPEGIKVNPYYRAGQAPALKVPVRPVGGWLVSQRIVVDNAATANATALDALQRGATSLGFQCPKEVDLEVLLNDVLIEHIHTDWAITDARVLDGLAQLIARRGLDAADVKGSIQYQPENLTAYFKQYAPQLPGFRLLVVPPTVADTLTEQTAQQLQKANGWVATLSQAGIAPAEVLPHIRFDIAVGTDYFFEIARIRALRALWMVICQQYVPGYTQPAFIHATNQKGTPEKDGYYDMIRQTTQALSAVLGGADSLAIVPHVATPDRGEAFQTRVARNVQLILQHESHLDSVADPSAGSWYLEHITAQLAENTWARFVTLTANT